MSKRRSRSIRAEGPSADAADAGGPVCFPMSDEGRQPAGEGVAGALEARQRGQDAERGSTVGIAAPSRAATRARRARAARPAGRARVLLPAPRGLHGACDDDVARDRAPVRAVALPPRSSAVRVASVALVVLIALERPTRARGQRVPRPCDGLVRALRARSRDILAGSLRLHGHGARVSGAHGPPGRFAPGSEGVALLERATLPDGSPAFDGRELSAHARRAQALLGGPATPALVLVALVVLALALARTRFRTVVPTGLLAGALATLAVAVSPCP